MPGEATVKITCLDVSGNGGQPCKRGRHEAFCDPPYGGEVDGRILSSRWWPQSVGAGLFERLHELLGGTLGSSVA